MLLQDMFERMRMGPARQYDAPAVDLPVKVIWQEGVGG